MRNAVQRRNHRERAQPIEREKWGILEKHKVGPTLTKKKKKKIPPAAFRPTFHTPRSLRFSAAVAKI